MKLATNETGRALILKLCEFKVKCQAEPFDGLAVLKKLVKQNRGRQNAINNKPKAGARY